MVRLRATFVDNELGLIYTTAEKSRTWVINGNYRRAGNSVVWTLGAGGAANGWNRFSNRGVSDI